MLVRLLRLVEHAFLVAHLHELASRIVADDHYSPPSSYYDWPVSIRLSPARRLRLVVCTV
jgi:hypothetical protein